jgi:hypothetical protein
MTRLIAPLIVLVAALPSFAGDEPVVSFTPRKDGLRIDVGGKPFATYVVKDGEIRRPFFAHVHAPSGAQVTRTHPPVEGKDATDHATYHPGLWLAFGDLGGADFWRNRASVRHVAYVEKPAGGRGAGRFAVRNRYEADGKAICDETCRVRVVVRPAGYMIVWDSEFTGDRDFAFGDQEEMGLGVRVATPLTVKNGGRIVDSAGRVNEKQVWGKTAEWCAYAGAVGDKKVGVLLMPHPDNFRKSWFHARDYGLLVANPFGQNAFTGGAPSRVVVRAGEPLRLRFGVLVYDGDPDLGAAYRDYLKLARAERP